MDFVKPAEKQILIDGLNINYKQIGDGNIPIILLHGWGISSDKYTETMRQIMISASGGPAVGGQFSIIIPDLPGFGKSDNPPKAWGVGEYAELVRKFTDVLGLKNFILIGHSFGGRIAIKFAAKYPEKFKALILTGAAGIKHPFTAKQKLFYAAAKSGKKIFSLPLINSLEKSAQKLLYKVIREKDYYEARGVMKEVFKKATGEDLTPFLDKIKAPTLLAWGELDKSTPLADAETMNLKIENCRLEIVGGASHSLPYQKPEKFAKITTDFISLNSSSFA